MLCEFYAIGIFTAVPLCFYWNVFIGSKSWSWWIVSWSERVFVEVLFPDRCICWISLVPKMLTLWNLRVDRKQLLILISFFDIKKSIHFLRLSPFATASDFMLKNRLNRTKITVNRRINVISITFPPAIFNYFTYALTFSRILFFKHFLNTLWKSLKLKTFIRIKVLIVIIWFTLYVLLTTFCWLFYWCYCLQLF